MPFNVHGRHADLHEEGTAAGRKCARAPHRAGGSKEETVMTGVKPKEGVGRQQQPFTAQRCLAILLCGNRPE